MSHLKIAALRLLNYLEHEATFAKHLRRSFGSFLPPSSLDTSVKKENEKDVPIAVVEGDVVEGGVMEGEEAVMTKNMSPSYRLLSLLREVLVQQQRREEQEVAAKQQQQQAAAATAAASSLSATATNDASSTSASTKGSALLPPSSATSLPSSASGQNTKTAPVSRLAALGLGLTNQPSWMTTNNDPTTINTTGNSIPVSTQQLTTAGSSSSGGVVDVNGDGGGGGVVGDSRKRIERLGLSNLPAWMTTTNYSGEEGGNKGDNEVGGQGGEGGVGRQGGEGEGTLSPPATTLSYIHNGVPTTTSECFTTASELLLMVPRLGTSHSVGNPLDATPTTVMAPASAAAAAASASSSSSSSAASAMASWESSTKGIGSKLLMNMGFIPGQGLGKQEAGNSLSPTHSRHTTYEHSRYIVSFLPSWSSTVHEIHPTLIH